jgi:LPPG:FO 2-phospho-L-lactate transferase
VRGWGRRGDTASALAVVSQLGGEDWFFLSDGDIGLHLVRTERLRRGEPLSAIMRDVCERLGVGVTLLPVTDETLRTLVTTDEGEVDFQTYFVRRRHEDDVRAVRYAGAEDARPAPGVVEAIGAADVVVVAPSNPFLSVEAILAVPGIRPALRRRARPVVGVSPIVAGRAIKGPADRMLRALVGDASPVAVAERYADFLTHMLVDAADEGSVAAIEGLGIRAGTAETVMIDPVRRPAVARAALDLAADMLGG